MGGTVISGSLPKNLATASCPSQPPYERVVLGSQKVLEHRDHRELSEVGLHLCDRGKMGKHAGMRAPGGVATLGSPTLLTVLCKRAHRLISSESRTLVCRW